LAQVTPLAHVPTLVLCAAPGADTAALLERLLAERPPRQTWAALVSARGAPRPDQARGVAIARLDGGCVCCTGQVALRVALTRLLRESRPARLFIELDATSHLREALTLLRGPWLAPVLAIEAVVGVVDCRSGADPAANAAPASCDVLCVRSGPPAVPGGAQRIVDAAHATLAALQGRIVSEPR
jgi:G3E family GTPase